MKYKGSGQGSEEVIPTRYAWLTPTPPLPKNEISENIMKIRFGFFLDALQYGTPPHGGIAFGLDRIIAILAGEPSIRDVMAFPKTAGAVDLMAGSPSTVDKQQLRDLHLDN